jgi:Pentapeptide repeats (8 copies)
VKTRADSFISRVVAAAARPTRPWLHIAVSTGVARFLLAAGARPGDLAGAYMEYAALAAKDLSGADLAGARLHHADLRRANLTGADLNGATLILANLSGADLAGAKLDAADLSGADLYEANLYEANLTGTLWSGSTRWPTAVAQVMRARSEEVQPGVWRVTGSGSAGAELGAPPTPVR